MIQRANPLIILQTGTVLIFAEILPASSVTSPLDTSSARQPPEIRGSRPIVTFSAYLPLVVNQVSLQCVSARFDYHINTEVSVCRSMYLEAMCTLDISTWSGQCISAKIISREHATISGVSYAAKIFSIGGCRARTLVREGSTVNPGVAILTVSGQARHVLKCERTALNLVSRMSGIATMTKKMVSAMPARGPEIYATRKTAPGLRFFDKEAVVAGGGRRHRMSLNSSVMIKDNHLDSGYSIDFLVQKARKKGYKKIQVEVEDARSALIAAKCGATTILLDNFTPKGAAAAVKVLQKARVRKNVTLEVSGGITVKNIASFAKIGVDAISSGQITSSAPAIDLSLEVYP